MTGYSPHFICDGCGNVYTLEARCLLACLKPGTHLCCPPSAGAKSAAQRRTPRHVHLDRVRQ